MDVDRVHERHLLRSFQLGSGLRVGVVAIMVCAMMVGSEPDEWPEQLTVVGLYGIVALRALFLAFSTPDPGNIGEWPRFAFAIVDVVAVLAFQATSDGGYIPLLVIGLVPLLVALEISWRRSVLVLTCSLVVFTIAIVDDPELRPDFPLSQLAFLAVIYVFFCCIALLVVNVQARQVDEIANLSSSREALLAETMTASEAQRRQISESIHDGPLQDVLAARQAVLLATKRSWDKDLEIALTSLKDAALRLREATFELHPAVLEAAGLDTAVEQLISFNTRRSGIHIDANINYPVKNAIDPIVFGAVRELLANVVRHSRADHATVTLAIENNVCVLDVVDNGVGISSETAAQRLKEGHIGLASQRARVEAAGGTFTQEKEPVGTHIKVRLPLKA